MQEVRVHACMAEKLNPGKKIGQAAWRFAEGPNPALSKSVRLRCPIGCQDDLIPSERNRVLNERVNLVSRS